MNYGRRGFSGIPKKLRLLQPGARSWFFVPTRLIQVTPRDAEPLGSRDRGGVLNSEEQ